MGIAAFLAVLAAAGTDGLSQPTLDAPRLDYSELVAQYRRDTIDWKQARHSLGSPSRLDFIVRSATATMREADLKASALLHTQLASQYLAPSADAERRLQLDTAVGIATTIGDSEFRRKWHLAVGYLNLSTLDEVRALSEFENAIEIDPKDPEATLATGIVHETAGAFHLAKVPRWSGPSASISLTRRDSRSIAVETKSGRQRLRSAIDVYDEVIRLHPGLVVAHLRRGRCYLLLGRENEAIEDLTLALQLSSQPHERGLSALFLGKLYRERGDLQEATAFYRMVVKSVPQWQVGYFALSESLDQRDRRAESRAILLEGMRTPFEAGNSRSSLWQYYLKLDAFVRIVTELRAQVLL